MELVTVKITGQAITARYGTLNSGAVLRTDAAFAKHLIEDCSVAEYVKEKPEPSTPAPKAAAKPARATSAPKKSGATGAPQGDGAGALGATGADDVSAGSAGTPAPGDAPPAGAAEAGDSGGVQTSAQPELPATPAQEG